LNVNGSNIKWYSSLYDTLGTDTVPVPRVDSLFRQVFYLTQNDGFCTSLKDSIVATVNNYGVSTNTDTSIYKGYGVFLTANGAQSYSWRPFIGLSDSTGDVVLAEPQSSICYIVYGKAANGCVGTDTVCITVLDPYSVKLPNIISPNGDALNQTWRIDMLPEFEKYEVTIMDRQGAVIMKKSPYDNSFNGSDSEGKELVNGVYFYYLRHTEQDIKFKGYIQVIR
jgi:gliding motility-associated-like protein